MTGFVCQKHERHCPDGVCPYCVPEPAKIPPLLPGHTPCACGEYSWRPSAPGEPQFPMEGSVDGRLHTLERCYLGTYGGIPVFADASLKPDEFRFVPRDVEQAR